ncbi:MAG: type IV pili methyl-accepting chemotaxis transducer N-terminal domain-containing protein [Myxococcota bacterium]
MHDEPQEVEGGLKRIRSAYIGALTLVAALTVLGQIVVQAAFGSQLQAAKIINLAGRQRMLSQKLAKQAVLPGAVQDEVSFKKDLAEWQGTHDALMRGELAEFVVASSEVDLEALDSAKLRLESVLMAMLATRAASSLQAEVLAHEASYLPKMNELVFAYSELAESRVAKSRILELTIALLTILIVALELAFVFTPLFKKLARTMHRLQETIGSLSDIERRYERAAFGSEDGLWDFCKFEQRLFWSSKFRSLAGLSPDVPADWATLQERILKPDRAAFEEALANPESVEVECEVKCSRRFST